MDAIIYLWCFKFSFETIKKYSQYKWILIEDRKHHQSKDEIPAGYFEEIYFTDLSSFQAVEEIVDQVAQRYTIKGVIATIEPVIELGGWLRSKLQLPGVQYDEAVSFRNKYKMKSLIRENQIKTADTLIVKTRDELNRFVADHGFPIILKPIDGFGTTNTAKILNLSELDCYLEQFGTGQPVLAENFIPGEEYHCDSFVVNGKVVFASVGKYLAPLLQVIMEKKPIGSIIFPKKKADELLAKVLECNEKSIKALKIQNAVCHAEYFLTPGKEVYFGELATRIGGGSLMGSCIQNTHNVNIYKSFIDVELSNYQPEPFQFTEKYTGFICFPSKAGVIRTISRKDDFKHIEGIIEYKLRNKIGERIEDVTNSAIRTGNAIVEDDDYQSLEAKLYQIYREFRLEVTPD